MTTLLNNDLAEVATVNGTEYVLVREERASSVTVAHKDSTGAYVSFEGDFFPKTFWTDDPESACRAALVLAGKLKL